VSVFVFLIFRLLQFRAVTLYCLNIELHIFVTARHNKRIYIYIYIYINLGSSPNQRQARVDKSFKHVRQSFLVLFVERQWERMKPRLEQRPPAQTLWLHVDHAAPRHLSRSQDTETTSI